MGAIPVIRVIDADHDRRGELLLRHEHDGRDLNMDYAEKTLGYVRRLWRRPVVLETWLDGEVCRLRSGEDEFELERANAD
jgi:stage V sporulation protein R